ncbi:MAG: hypothetical protein KKA67_15010 [Spirochaetes bacterium]|nr:hypothetical protein [Spirochaetota bacterium]MBU1082089.1 hypothetical protein [Spirochaetota bacterium]
MKKAAILILAALVAVPALYAEDEGKRDPFAISIGAEAAIGLTGAFAGAQARFVWQPGFLGLSVGVGADAGVSVADVYLIPSAGVRIGWLALDGGASIKLVDAPAPAGLTEAALQTVAPFARAGLSIPIGPIALDVGARLMMTDTYAEMAIDSVGDLIAAPFAMAIVTALGFVKIDAGISYVLRF